MDVSGIGGVSGGYMPTPAIQSAPAAASAQAAGSASSVESVSTLSINSTSMNSVSETMMSSTAAMGNKDLLGAILLMLTMQYLKGSAPTDDEKKQLLGLVMALAQQQPQQDSNQITMYSSSSLSIESTQIQATSIGGGQAGYSGASAVAQIAPGVDPGAGGLNVTA